MTPRGELTLPAGDVELEIASPYFETDAIPGTTTYPFDVAATGDNPRVLNHPHLFRGPGGPPPEPTDCYLEGVLWRRGSLVFRSFDAQKKVYRYNFVADATDLAKQLAGVKLPELLLPDLVLAAQSATPEYVLAPVRNTEFFDEKNGAFTGILNWPSPAGVLGAPGPNQVYVPMLYLVPAVRAVLATIGYAVEGTWVDDPEVQAAVIYSDRALASTVAFGDAFNPARQLPNLTVPELLLALQNYFCLGLQFQPGAKVLRLDALRDRVQRGGYVARPGAVLTTAGTNDTRGFRLVQQADTDDELDKTLDVGWQQLQVGAGQEEIRAAAGTLHQVREADPNTPGREWLVPAISAKGASAEYGLGDDSRTGLRLLFDRGLCPDSHGHPYRLLSSGTVDYAGASVGAYSLHWDGPQGLYAQWHRPWLDFRSRAVPREYTVPFRLADLLTLDPATHELVDYHLLLWQKVSLRVSAGSPLRTATITYQELL
ncbi:hypothetical protein [Hymenobacter sp. BT523]|uniref:hypothetical protein n=1 Tax=Hymenobacter sp. BT523 TaxID=2795725 RepID=UPI0018ECBBF1|nr:hypothetical protein [Hymenobacter sp. BT523]